MDFKAIEEMIKTMDNSKLGYLEVNWQGISIIMRKEGEPPFSVPVRNSEAVEKEINVINRDVTSKADEEIKEPANNIVRNLEQPVETKLEDGNIKEVRSPIVGTFYTSAGPDKPPFVKVGSKVKKGDTLCIIEAMKLMNEIQSEFEGEVVEIQVNNEQMVEYGQSMFKIKVQG